MYLCLFILETVSFLFATLWATRVTNGFQSSIFLCRTHTQRDRGKIDEYCSSTAPEAVPEYNEISVLVQQEITFNCTGIASASTVCITSSLSNPEEPNKDVMSPIISSSSRWSNIYPYLTTVSLVSLKSFHLQIRGVTPLPIYGTIRSLALDLFLSG
jgi:hypothetical protein